VKYLIALAWRQARNGDRNRLRATGSRPCRVILRGRRTHLFISLKNYYAAVRARAPLHRTHPAALESTLVLSSAKRKFAPEFWEKFNVDRARAHLFPKTFYSNPFQLHRRNASEKENWFIHPCDGLSIDFSGGYILSFFFLILNNPRLTPGMKDSKARYFVFIIIIILCARNDAFSPISCPSI